MIAIVHLLVALVLIKAFRLDRTEAFAVLLFGVLIDLDHVFALVDFWSMAGMSGALDYQAAMATDLEWKSLFHSPAAAIIIGPACAGFRMATPGLAWGLHLALDWVQIEYLGVLSAVEMALLVALVVALICMEKFELEFDGQKHTYREATSSLMHQGGAELVRLSGRLRAFPRLRDMPS
jgi:hypothetical protein